MNGKLILFLLSFYAISMFSDWKTSPFHQIIENDDSPYISKDQVSDELLKKVGYVLGYIDTYERTPKGIASGDKSRFHVLNAKIAQSSNSKRRGFGYGDEKTYKGYDTTLTQKELEFIIQWFNEKYEMAIKDKEQRYKRRMFESSRIGQLASAIKLYKDLQDQYSNWHPYQNQYVLPNWHPYQKYRDNKYKISDFSKKLWDTNPFL